MLINHIGIGKKEVEGWISQEFAVKRFEFFWIPDIVLIAGDNQYRRRRRRLRRRNFREPPSWIG